MLFHKLDLLDVDQNVTRPVVMDIGRNIVEIMGLPKGIEISYIGQGEARHQFGSTVGQNEAEVRVGNSAMLTIEAVSSFDETNFSATAAHNYEHEPLFTDDSIGVVVKPIYQGCTVTLNFQYETPSRNEAIRWRNDASFKVSQLRNVILQNATYCYILPNSLWAALKDIYDLREKQAGYGQTFPQYLETHLSPLATRIADSTGTHTRIGIRETQMEIQGFFNFTAQPEQQEREGDRGTWTVRFSYEFSFQQPTAISFQMPVLVHNQPVAQKYLPLEDNKHIQFAKRASISKGGFMMFSADAEMQRNKPALARFNWPPYDHWFADKVPDNCAIIASFLIGANKTDAGQKLLNLRELGDYVIQSDILKWIEGAEYPYLHVPRASPLQIALYRNECLASFKTVTVDQDLNVVLNQELDLRKRYRIVLMLNKKLNVDPAGVKRLAQYPDATRLILRTIRATTSDIYSYTPHVDLRMFADACLEGGISYQDVVNSIVSMKVQNQGGIETTRV